MADHRKPDIIFLLRIPGKRKSQKVELFHQRQYGLCPRTKKYRIRVQGKWYRQNEDEKRSFLSQYEFRDLLWRSIKDKF